MIQMCIIVHIIKNIFSKNILEFFFKNKNPLNLGFFFLSAIILFVGLIKKWCRFILLKVAHIITLGQVVLLRIVFK